MVQYCVKTLLWDHLGKHQTLTILFREIHACHLLLGSNTNKNDGMIRRNNEVICWYDGINFYVLLYGDYKCVSYCLKSVCEPLFEECVCFSSGIGRTEPMSSVHETFDEERPCRLEIELSSPRNTTHCCCTGTVASIDAEERRPAMNRGRTDQATDITFYHDHL